MIHSVSGRSNSLDNQKGNPLRDPAQAFGAIPMSSFCPQPIQGYPCSKDVTYKTFNLICDIKPEYIDQITQFINTEKSSTKYFVTSASIEYTQFESGFIFTVAARMPSAEQGIVKEKERFESFLKENVPNLNCTVLVGFPIYIRQIALPEA